MNHHPGGPDGHAAFERAQERDRRDPPARAAGPEDHRQDRQAREDGRTWTEGHAWTDQDRAGIQRLTKDTAAPREETDDQRVIREYDERNAAREESNRRIDRAAYQRTPYTYTREPRPTREPRAPQLRTDGHRREYTRARRSPATAARAPPATAMPSPTWGCTAPWRTRTYPSSTTTITPTSPAAR